MRENEGITLEAIAQRNAWQVQSPRHSKQTNFHEVRFHEARFRETAVLSFNCSGSARKNYIVAMRRYTVSS